MATSKSVEVIEIRPIEVKRATVRIVGDTPLIMHAWSEKAKREMLEKQMKVTKTKAKAAKDPIEDFIRSMYWKTPMPTDMTQAGFERAISEGARFCFPVTAIMRSEAGCHTLQLFRLRRRFSKSTLYRWLRCRKQRL